MLAGTMVTSLSSWYRIQALQWSHQLAEALAYLHSAIPMVIHRDLKLVGLNRMRRLGTGCEVPGEAAKHP
eukprot:1160680-Pelagomonas_calceolata.AAC.8